MTQALAYGLPVKTFDATTIDNTLEGTIFAVPPKPLSQGFIWQTVHATTPSAISVSLRVSIDGTNWTIIDTSTSTAGETRTILNKQGLFVEGYITSHTGGSTTTVYIVHF